MLSAEVHRPWALCCLTSLLSWLKTKTKLWEGQEQGWPADQLTGWPADQLTEWSVCKWRMLLDQQCVQCVSTWCKHSIAELLFCVWWCEASAAAAAAAVSSHLTCCVSVSVCVLLSVWSLMSVWDADCTADSDYYYYYYYYYKRWCLKWHCHAQTLQSHLTNTKTVTCWQWRGSGISIVAVLASSPSILMVSVKLLSTSIRWPINVSSEMPRPSITAT